MFFPVLNYHLANLAVGWIFFIKMGIEKFIPTEVVSKIVLDSISLIECSNSLQCQILLLVVVIMEITTYFSAR